MSISAIKLEGFDELLNAVKQLPDKTKKTFIAGIMRKNMKPIAAAIKAIAPVRDRQGAITRKRKDGTISTQSESGNLQKSIGIKTFTRGEVTAYAGIQKRKNDGWYGFFVERGTKYQSPQNFIQRGASMTVPKAADNLTTDIKDYIVSNAKKLGLDAK